MLKFWFESGKELKYTSDALDLASKNGHLEVLRLWFESGKELKYTSYALNWASKNDHLKLILLLICKLSILCEGGL